MSSQIRKNLEFVGKARECSASGDHGQAFLHYLAALKLHPVSAPNLEKEFAQNFKEWGDLLVSSRRVSDFFNCCEQAVRAYPNSSIILFEAGKIIMKAGCPMEACGFFQKALKTDPSYAEAEIHLDSAKNLLVERWHYRMLNDSKRNSSYRRAIMEVVNKGDVVLDIGCGSGLLSFYAADAGASKVIACDSSVPMYQIASKAFEQNDVQNVIVLNESSENIDINEYGGRVSVVVAEIFDAGLFGEGALQTLSDAWKRLLIPYPAGKVLPMKAAIYMCGIRSETLAKKYRFVHSEYNNILSYIKFENVNVYEEVKEPYDTEDLNLFDDIKYVTNIEKIIDINFQDVNDLNSFLSVSPISKIVSLKVLEKGKIDAFAMWFDLILSENVSLTSNPRQLDRCSAWDTAIFHLPNSYNSEELNDEITLSMGWLMGTIRLMEERRDYNDNIFVPKEVIRILNDSEYINGLIGAVGASCVHLVHLYPFESLRVLDYTPFPLAGILMLMRGIQTLICTSTSKELILKLAANNNIDTNKIIFLENKDLNESIKCEMIINYLVEPLGQLRYVDISFMRCKKVQMLQRGGISIPFKLKMIAKLIYSEHLDKCNRVHDSNISKSVVMECADTAEDNISRKFEYQVADHINTYQVTQNSFRASEKFDKKDLSKEVVIYDQCLNPYSCETIQVDVIRDGVINAIQSYYKFQFLSNGKELSTDNTNSYVNNVYHLVDPPIFVKKGDKLDILVFSENNDSIKMVLDAGD